MHNKKSKLQQLREDFLADIKAILDRHALDEMDLTDCGSAPVIWPSADDQDFDTYTLDRVYAQGVNILVDSSSSDNNRTDNATNLDTDTLVEILEFLEDNENSIWEKDKDPGGEEPLHENVPSNQKKNIFVLHQVANNDGVNNSCVVDVYTDRTEAEAKLKEMRDKFVKGLDEDDNLESLDQICDTLTDKENFFCYYKFDTNHLFQLEVVEKEI